METPWPGRGLTGEPAAGAPQPGRLSLSPRETAGGKRPITGRRRTQGAGFSQAIFVLLPTTFRTFRISVSLFKFILRWQNTRNTIFHPNRPCAHGAWCSAATAPSGRPTTRPHGTVRDKPGSSTGRDLRLLPPSDSSPGQGPSGVTVNRGSLPLPPMNRRPQGRGRATAERPRPWAPLPRSWPSGPGDPGEGREAVRRPRQPAWDSLSVRSSSRFRPQHQTTFILGSLKAQKLG